MFKYNLYGNTPFDLAKTFITFFWKTLTRIEKIKFLRDLLHYPGLKWTVDMVDAATKIHNIQTNRRSVTKLLQEVAAHCDTSSETYQHVNAALASLSGDTVQQWNTEFPPHKHFYDNRPTTCWMDDPEEEDNTKIS